MNKEYKIEMKFNGETFNEVTEDPKKAIMSFKQEMILTESYITITKGEAEFQRKLTLVQTRKIFNDEVALDIFINNILF